MTDKPTARDLHHDYVASLTDDDLGGPDTGVIDRPTPKDDASVSGPYATLVIKYPTPDDLEPVLYDAVDDTSRTVGNDA